MTLLADGWLRKGAEYRVGRESCEPGRLRKVIANYLERGCIEQINFRCDAEGIKMASIANQDERAGGEVHLPARKLKEPEGGEVFRWSKGSERDIRAEVGVEVTVLKEF